MDSPVLAPVFVSFIACWIYERHYLNIRFLISILTEFKTVGILYPFPADWVNGIFKCKRAFWIMSGFLWTLQALNIFWLFLILRIAYRFVKSWGEDAVDERSDDEDEDDSERSSEEEKSTF